MNMNKADGSHRGGSPAPKGCPVCGEVHRVCSCGRARMICPVDEPGEPFAWCEYCEAEEQPTEASAGERAAVWGAVRFFLKTMFGPLQCMPGAVQLHFGDVHRALWRHARGDWGDCPPHRWAANDNAEEFELDIVSTHTDRWGTRFCLKTPPDGSRTIVLLESEER